MSIKRIIYRSFVLLYLVLAIYFLIYTVFNSHKLWDFNVFYGAARNAITGTTIYTYYDNGQGALPFWYFPWVSWIFMPLALFPYLTAWYIYLIIGLLVCFLAINSLAKYYPGNSLFDRLYMFSSLIWMSWLAYEVGQISYIVLGIAVLVIIMIDRGHYYTVGLLTPLMLIKPHLFIIFIPLVLWLGGKKAILTSALIILALFVVETLITPNWIGQMINLLLLGTKRVDFNPSSYTTLPTLIGISQNNLGTANLPIPLILIAISAFVIIRFRSLPKIAWLSMAMAASLFCAPRTYAYDLVLLIPAMIWLSENWTYKSVILWLAAALIPLYFHFSSGSYTVTLLVFCLCTYKAYRLERNVRLRDLESKAESVHELPKGLGDHEETKGGL